MQLKTDNLFLVIDRNTGETKSQAFSRQEANKFRDGFNRGYGIKRGVRRCRMIPRLYVVAAKIQLVPKNS